MEPDRPLMTRLKRVVLALGIGLAGLGVATMVLGGPTPGRILQFGLDHPRSVLAAIGITGLGAGLWISRKYGELLWVASATLLLGSTWIAMQVERRFPNNSLLSPSGYAKAVEVLLGQSSRPDDPAPVPAPANPGVVRAKYRAVDSYFHAASLDSGITPERLVAVMDSVGVHAVVNHDGLSDSRDRFARTFEARYPGRFFTFVKVPVGQAHEREFVQQQIASLEAAARRGARGITVSRGGITTGTPVALDDTRLDFIWRFSAARRLPVFIPSAEPAVATGSIPRLLRKHPSTVFIGAHLDSTEASQASAAGLLDRYPNYYLALSSPVPTFGRRPDAARRFFIRYQDRILFGTGGGYGLDRINWTIERFYQTHFQFLETKAEYFDFPPGEHARQGPGRITGLGLPDTVLAKLYSLNAARLILGESTAGSPEGSR